MGLFCFSQTKGSRTEKGGNCRDDCVNNLATVLPGKSNSGQVAYNHSNNIFQSYISPNQ